MTKYRCLEAWLWGKRPRRLGEPAHSAEKRERLQVKDRFTAEASQLRASGTDRNRFVTILPRQQKLLADDQGVDLVDYRQESVSVPARPQ